MNHAEDEQPNESAHGRPKRILPFVMNTSRGRGQGMVRGGYAPPERGRGRGRGRGFGRGASLVPGLSRGGHSRLSETVPSYSGGPNHHLLPLKPQVTWPPEANGSEPTGVSVVSGGVQAPEGATSQTPHSRRRKFRPKMRDRPQMDGLTQRAGTLNPSLGNQTHSYVDAPLNTTDAPPPAKRPRILEDLGPTSDLPPEIIPAVNVKAEEADEPSTSSCQGQANTGTKFITYDNYPKCCFSCGKPPDEVRNNRRSVKGQEVLALRKQGLTVDAVFIRDDGIAIDWSRPALTDTSVKISITPSELLSSQPELGSSITPDEPTLITSREASDAPSSSSKPLPSHLDPLVTAAYTPPSQRLLTPALMETTHREIRVPPRHLPRRGDTRKLEIWVLEQMRLLEAELGPVLVPPPELIGIGEYISGQPLSSDTIPCVRIRYKRPARIAPTPQAENQLNVQQAEGRDVISSAPWGTYAVQARSNPTSPISSTDVALPPIAHLPRSPLPTARADSPPTAKAEKDELALDPPSPLATPRSLSPNIPLAESRPLPPASNLDNPIEAYSRERALGKRRMSPCEGPYFVQPLDVQPIEELDEIQRLRQDLETSRLEAEQKHRDLERRILELSQKRPEPGTPGVEVLSTSSADNQTRIADESKSKLLVLRRGKHDKTRRLLSPTPSAVLHVSWLGAMQLINRDTRRIVATGFEDGAPNGISVDDACLLSASSAALGLAGSGPQLGITTLCGDSFKFVSLPDQPHEAKGVCAVAAVDPSTVVTLGHDHRYVHWRFEQDSCSTTSLPMPKLHQCTALAYEPVVGNLVTAGSDTGKHSKLSVHCLLDAQNIPTTVELSNHVHHIHTDPENPSLLILELARLDDQFQVHDMRLPLHQCVQKFGYQSIVHERGGFRTRGSTKGHLFARGDIGIVRTWDRRHLSTYQTIPVIPHQKVVEVILNSTSLVCATEFHHVVSYPTF